MSPREKQGRQRQRHASLERVYDDNQVLTFNERCRLNRISLRNGRRILKGPGGPKVLQLSQNRIGIRYADNRGWQESRARA
jgi:hypothetical protein